MYVISRPHKARPKVVGRKAYNLFKLKKYFSVPQFAVVSTQAFQDYRTHKTINPELERDLRRTLEHFLEKGPIAIRSSSTTEDLQGISFAGMYVTTLNISNVVDGINAVERTWNSADTNRVRQYCQKMNSPMGNMAVIIQHQLIPELSGVMVTQSPFSVKEILIECCRGLGEKLVSGHITPTRYRIRGYTIIERTGDNLLSKSQLLSLVESGKKIEKMFRSPQDIEWALEDGKLYILQSRPVVVHASVPRRRGMVWSNVNVRETIPEPISPFCWSLFDNVIFPSLLMDAFRIPINQQQYKKYRPVELLSGRLYWNINNTIAYGKAIGPILDLLEGSESVDPQMATAFKAVDVKNLPQPIPGFTMFKFTTVSLIRMAYYLGLSFFRYRWMAQKIRKVHEDSDALYEQLQPVNDIRQGIRNIKSWTRLVLDKFARRYFGGVLLSICYLIILGKLLRIRLGNRGDALARKTIIGIVDKTGEMALALHNLASYAREKREKMTITNLKKLYMADNEFKNLFDTFIREFGHRGPAEFDIASPNWREDYDMVYQIILTAGERGMHTTDREAAIHKLLKTAQPFEKFVLKKFLPRIELFTPLRENGKHIYLKCAAKSKDQLFMIHEILRKKGYIKQHRDIFFLTLQELEAIAEGRLKGDDSLKLIKTRKEEWHTYRQAVAPDIIYESGERITAALTPSNVLSGEPLSFGKTKARIRIVKNFGESHRLKKGEILVTHHTDPGWTPLFTVCSGVIIEVGGLICHAAMVARELGLPAIVVKGALSLIPDGTMVELDADEGCVTIISNAK